MNIGAVSMVSALGTHLSEHWREERRRHAGSRPAGPGQKEKATDAFLTDWVVSRAVFS